MIRTRNVLLSLIFVVFAASCSVRGGTLLNSGIKNTGFEVEFIQWNREYKCAMDLEQDDKISVEIDCESGSLSLDITSKKGENAFTGEDLEKEGFSVTVPETGEYVITVRGKNAKGIISVRNTTG